MQEGMHDVTVRVPVWFETPMEAAGFIERAVVQAMERAGYVGGCAVIVRDGTEFNQLRMFRDGEGFSDPGRLPHGLVEPRTREVPA